MRSKIGHAKRSLAVVASLIALGVTRQACGEDSGKVVTYKAPAAESVSTDFQLWAAGLPVDIYTARVLDPPFANKQWDYGGNYAFANFDMTGRVVVRVVAKRSLRNVVIRPESAGIKPQLQDDHTLLLTIDTPRKLSIEPDGKKGPLLLFANPMEVEAPHAGDPGVVYYGPGVHKPGSIRLTSGQTLYLAGGAVVKAEIAVEGKGIKIRGRGILDGSDWEWRHGPLGFLIGIRNSRDVEVSGVTLRGSSHWTLVPMGSQHVTIRNVKICNGRVQNDDGMNPCNSQDVLITDCFIRTDDDCVAMKGLSMNLSNNHVERVTVEKSVLWCDRARIFLLGHESRAAFLRDVTLRDLDIIHFTMTAFLFEPGEDMRLEHVIAENIRIHGEGQRELIRLKPVVNQYMRKKVPGFVADVRFKDVTVAGKPGPYLIQVEGAEGAHSVRNAAFDVTVLGNPVTRDSPSVQVGRNTENISFAPAH